jgi:hypothetical protein
VKANPRPPSAADSACQADQLRRLAQGQGRDRRGQRQRQAGRQPLRQSLDRHQGLQRQRPGRQQIQRPVLQIALEHPLQRQQGGQRQRHPRRA